MSPPTRGLPFTILHLGVGAFHRAHQAVYMQALADRGDRSWRLVSGELRPDGATTVAALQAQQGAYTLETVDPSGAREYRLITAIDRVLAFEPRLTEVIEVGSDAGTRIISFTVTEAGYYLKPSGLLEEGHPDLLGDLEGGNPRTLYGALAAILKQRRAKGSGGVTLLNCDNLRCNGDKVRLGLLQFLERRGELDLMDWVASHTTCPNSMVDRITPRPSREVAQRVEAATGRRDAVPVMAERYLQWVVEDHFFGGRPDWASVGVELVDSVHPYEEAKIRILNASHSCIAWAGTLLGDRYIHEGVRRAGVRRMAFEYVTEDVIPALHPSPIPLALYRDTVLERFSNPYLLDTNQRVAMDGYSKLPGFIVPTLQDRLRSGHSFAKTARLPALFFAVLQLWHKGELPYEYQDQAMDPGSVRAIFEAPDPLAAFVRDPVLWGSLRGSEVLEQALRSAYDEVGRLVLEEGLAANA
ncbi:mannitol dehydrogenase family protein [Aquabacterium sp. A7-Y]|uniref:D-arabinitol 4-dehydrogenase n=1 Tax=Aquabacterium sp. A7-Y TaxID=1349605 RepID=UPI00223D26E8|nr:D-arabinitol 4-dehydrogenase [Aquabacterium sp. A7-Y]MCW7537893.1 mannitol dehydrogenase family protein [Aquabacterium sp. A7-Y]